MGVSPASFTITLINLQHLVLYFLNIPKSIWQILKFGSPFFEKSMRAAFNSDIKFIQIQQITFDNPANQNFFFDLKCQNTKTFTVSKILSHFLNFDKPYHFSLQPNTCPQPPAQQLPPIFLISSSLIMQSPNINPSTQHPVQQSTRLMIMMNIYLLLIGLLLTCNCFRINVDSYLRPPRQSLYEQTYVIIGTNDIHGAAYPTSLMRGDTKEKYNYGGLATMASLIDIFRKEYGDKNVLYLDAGDHFQGGIEASKLVSNGMIINEFFNAESVSTTALGNHEFDFGPSFLNLYLKNSVSRFMAANLYSEKDEPVTSFLPNTGRSQLFTLNDNFKVGVIGLITTDTPVTSSGFTQHLFPDYKFKDYTDFVLAEAKSLRSNGAHAVVIMAHEGNVCPGQTQDMGIWKKNSSQGPCPDGPITHILDLLPAGTIDAVVQGHRHTTVHFYHDGVPIIGNINGGFYFNAIYLTWNKLTKKIVDTSIEGPIPVCEKIFSKIKRCPYVAPAQLKDAGELVNWKFHNQDVKPSDKVNALFNEWLPLMKPYLEDLVENEVYLEVAKDKQSELGNLVSDLYFKAGKGNVGFSLVNPGSFRTTWSPGILQYQHFYNMFPFDNTLDTFVITGRELKAMYRVLQSGRLGFYISSGLDMKVTINERTLVDISTHDGDEIVDDENYIGITSNFLLDGGDDMKNVIGSVYTPRNRTVVGDVRQVLKEIVKDMKIIKEGTLIDPDHPRLVVVNQ